MRVTLLFSFIVLLSVVKAQVLEEKVLGNYTGCEHTATYISKHPFNSNQYLTLTKSTCSRPSFTGVVGTISWLDYKFDTIEQVGVPFLEIWLSGYGNPIDMSFFLVASNSNYVIGDSVYVGNVSFVSGPQHYKAFMPSMCNYEESDYYSGPNENIIVVNYQQGNCGNYKDASITSLDYSYNINWEYKYEGAKNDEIHSIKKLDDGSLLALGHSNTKSVKTNLFLLSLDSNGRYQDAYNVGDTLSHTLSNDMEVDTSGNVYIVWNKSNQLNITKLNSNLEAQWDLPLNTYGLEDIEIQFSKNDNSLILISNGLNPFTSGFEQMVYKIDVRGNIVWKRMFDERISDFIIKSDGSFLLYGDDDASDYTQIIHFDSTFASYPPLQEEDPDSTFNPNSDSSDVQTVGILDFSLNESYSVYPNPFSDYITISSEQIKIKHYSIYNMMGQLVSGGVVESTNKRISFEQNAQGAYILQVELEDGTFKTDKIIYSK